MGIDRWSDVRALARATREQFVEAEPASHGLALVEALLAQRGYEVARYPGSHPLLGGAWAALFPEADLIACAGELSRERQAFALAHELAHLVLHAGGASCCGDPDISPDAGPADMAAGALE